MISILAGIAFAASLAGHVSPMAIQFTHGEIGENVTVWIDGSSENAFAGKLSFHNGSRAWMSLCADVRSPITDGQVFAVRVTRTDKMSPNYAKAGSIVARFFNRAQTNAQCAGLQLAVWKAIEDGGDQADFSSGHFRVIANPDVLSYATMYYGAALGGGSAFLLQAGQSQGQQGGGQGTGQGAGQGGQSQISP